MSRAVAWVLYKYQENNRQHNRTDPIAYQAYCSYRTDRNQQSPHATHNHVPSIFPTIRMAIEAPVAVSINSSMDIPCNVPIDGYTECLHTSALSMHMPMRSCQCMYVHLHVSGHVHVSTHMCVYTCMHMVAQMSFYMCTYVSGHIFVHVCTHACT